MQIIVSRCVFTNGEERTIRLMGVIHRPPISFASLTTIYKCKYRYLISTYRYMQILPNYYLKMQEYSVTSLVCPRMEEQISMPIAV